MQRHAFSLVAARLLAGGAQSSAADEGAGAERFCA